MNGKAHQIVAPHESAVERFWGYFPYLIFLIALGIRLLVLWQLSENYHGFNEPAVDSRWHLLWAKQIAAGDWLGGGVFYRAPLYPYLLAGIIAVFGENLWLIRILHALIGSLTVVLVFFLGRRVFNRGIGAAAALVWATWATAIYYESEFLIPVLIIPLNLWVLYRLVGVLKTGRWNTRHALLTGLIIGLSAIARPNILIFVVALLPWLYWRFSWPSGNRGIKWISLSTLLIGVSLPIAVVTVRNAVVGDDFVPIAYQGGVNLYLGNNPQSDGLTMIMPDIRLDESIDWTEFVRTTDSLACLQSGRALKPSEISNFWVGKTIDSVLAHPLRELGLLGKKLFYFWHGFENGDNTDIYRHTQYSWLLGLGLWHYVIWFPLGLLSACGLWGLWITRRDSRAVELLNLFVWVYLLTVVGFLVTARHRLPVAPLIIIFAMAGGSQMIKSLRSKIPLIKKISGGLIIVSLLVVTNISLFEVGLANPIQYHYQQGIIYDRRGEYPQAIESYNKALAIWPNHFPSRHNLAYDLYRLGRYEEAIEHFTWALGAKQDDPKAFNNLGLAYRANGDTVRALGVFRLALQKNPRLIESHLNVGDTYRAGGQHDKAEIAYLKALGIDSTYGPALNNLGLLYLDRGRRDRAEEIFTRGITGAPDYPFCWLNLGALYLETNRPQFAIGPLLNFLNLRPHRLEAKFNLAVAYLRIGRVAVAKTAIDEILAVQPQNPRARALLEQIINQGK